MRAKPVSLRSLHDKWTLGGVTIPNRVVLAPLAGIGNWFVRLQAKRFGAGLAVSEMVSSFAIHYGNRKTLAELLVIRPEEKAAGPVAIQLFGQDPAIMRGAAARSLKAPSEISTPGKITPPRYSPSADTTSCVTAVPKSTTTQGPPSFS